MVSQSDCVRSDSATFLRGDFSTDLDLVQEVGRLINGLIRSLFAPATSH